MIFVGVICNLFRVHWFLLATSKRSPKSPNSLKPLKNLKTPLKTGSPQRTAGHFGACADPTPLRAFGVNGLRKPRRPKRGLGFRGLGFRGSGVEGFRGFRVLVV